MARCVTPFNLWPAGSRVARRQAQSVDRRQAHTLSLSCYLRAQQRSGVDSALPEGGERARRTGRPLPRGPAQLRRCSRKTRHWQMATSRPARAWFTATSRVTFGPLVLTVAAWRGVQGAAGVQTRSFRPQASAVLAPLLQGPRSVGCEPPEASSRLGSMLHFESRSVRGQYTSSASDTHRCSYVLHSHRAIQMEGVQL